MTRTSILQGVVQNQNVPQMMPTATISVAAVQNTWYTVLDTTLNVELVFIVLRMNTLAENIEVRLTIDDLVLDGAQANAGAETLYFVYHSSFTDSLVMTTTCFQTAYYANLKGRKVKVEIRKTSANGANNLQGFVIFEKY